MSYAPGQLVTPQDALTCCGGTPENCFYAAGASRCPTGYNPQFCCMADGTVTSALIMPDNGPTSTSFYSYCPVLGSLKTSDVNQCNKVPVQHCCYEGSCYPSKNYLGNNCYSAGANFGKEKDAGQTVSDCKQCAHRVTCCQQQPLLNSCYHQPFCNQGDSQVAKCEQCPFPTVPPWNFQSKNMNWMK